MNQATAIVTGAGRGIGRATALVLARAEYHVVVAARSAAELLETHRLVTEGGGLCTAIPCDLTESGQVQELIEETVESCGRIDVLVNNAGVAPRAGIVEMDMDTFDQMMRINVYAVFLACRAVWPIMQDQGGGTIINISSLASFDPFPGFAAYGATKAWVNLFTKAVSEEGRSARIRVFAIAPGAVETASLRSALPSFPADQTLAAEEVAGMVAALLDPRCVYATGTVIPIRK